MILKIKNWIREKLVNFVLPPVIEMEEEEELLILKELNKVEGFKRYLESMIVHDIYNYYLMPEEDKKGRWLIKGIIMAKKHFLREMPLAEEKLKTKYKI